MKDHLSEEASINIKNLVRQSIRISDDLYGNNMLSAQELKKGYTRPKLSDTSPTEITMDRHEAQEKLQAPQKLNLSLRHKSTSDIPDSLGNKVEVYVKSGHEKRGK